MKHKSLILTEQREAKLNAQKSMLDLARSEAPEGEELREFTEDEQSRFDTLTTEIEALDTQIEIAKRNEAQAARIASMAHSGTTQKQPEEEKVMGRFSLLKAVNLLSQNKPLDGVEKEVVEEGIKEADEFGLKTVGNLVLPSQMIGRTTLTAGTDATAGYLVDTTLEGFIPTLRPKLMVEQLGATMLRGLKGDVAVPKRLTDSAAAWEGEGDTAAESNPTYGLPSITPHRLGLYTDVSRQLLIQSSIDVENELRNIISFAIAKAVDTAVINGASDGDDPTGILNTTGIGAVTGGTNGATPDWADVVGLETAVAVDNADMGALAYLTTPGVRGLLKVTPRVASTEGMIWTGNTDPLNGYKAEVSTQVPSSLTKGTSENVCHAIIFGNWNDLVIGQWGGTDIIVDPYTQATAGKVRMHVFSWWDVLIRHAESFAAMKDALLS